MEERAEMRLLQLDICVWKRHQSDAKCDGIILISAIKARFLCISTATLSESKDKTQKENFQLNLDEI